MKYLIVLALSCSAFACGKERVVVKNSITIGVPTRYTIAQLARLAGPTKKQLLQLKAERLPNEVPAEIEARVTAFKLEADGDIHIVLKDSALTMIAEIPSAGCVTPDLRASTAIVRDKFTAKFGKATPRLKRVRSTERFVFRGQVFFDFIHGQTGVAKNGVELHPVTDFH